MMPGNFLNILRSAGHKLQYNKLNKRRIISYILYIVACCPLREKWATAINRLFSELYAK
jgi:hypothetical protein